RRGAHTPSPPIDRIASGASTDVDILVGTNADDWRFSPVLGGFIVQITEAVLTGPVEAYGFWSIAAYGLRPETALPHYRAATRFGGAPGDVLGAVMTDWWVRVPAMRLADAHAPAPGGTFMYEFAWPSPIMGGRLGYGPPAPPPPGGAPRPPSHPPDMLFVFAPLAGGQGKMGGGAGGAAPPQELA